MGLFDNVFGGGDDIKMPSIEDLTPLLQASADFNRINTSSPFGQIKYTKEGPTPMTYDDWLAENPGPFHPGQGQYYGGPAKGGGIFDSSSNPGNTMSDPNWQPGSSNYDPRAEYDKYASGFTSKDRADFSYSPELQGIFDKQFDPNAYDKYKDDYMQNYNALLEPGRDNQMDRFQQSMIDRGTPEGGPIYGDIYRETIGDPWARQDLMAATNAQQMSDKARLDDFNRLMAAMSGSQINVPPVDVMSAANLAGNINMQNAANQSSIWDTLPTLAGAYMLGAPDNSWFWGGTGTP
jgi:hypothetical protein